MLHDKRQFHQDHSLDKSSSNTSSSNTSTRNDDREHNDDKEFGTFEYPDITNKIDVDKQEGDDIDDFYQENDELEHNANTNTRGKDKNKTDIIYTKSNPYMTLIEWSNWDIGQPVPIKHSFWMLHPNVILWAIRA